jgi:hypothetical protein
MESNPANLDLIGLLCSSYYSYLELGYPKDPSIYVVKASSKTFNAIKRYLDKKQTIPEFNFDDANGTIGFTDGKFKIKVDPNLKLGEINFGPETLELKWKGI